MAWQALENNFSMFFRRPLSRLSFVSLLYILGLFQVNQMTSWIDASFVYSTKEAWVNSMRTFSNGSLKMDGNPIFGMPVKNTQRVPLANHPAPHVLRMLSPERMYCK